MVRRICKAVDLDVECSNLSDFETTASEALRRLVSSHSSTQDRAGEFTRKDRADEQNTRSNPDELRPCSSEADRLQDAPLLNLFKEAMVIQPTNEGDDEGYVGPADKRHITASIDALKALIPQPNDLTLILDSTEKFWLIWPVQPAATNIPFSSTTLSQSSRLTAGRDFILNSLQSQDPVTIAKAILWLTLCVQQLPEDIWLQTKMPADQNTLQGAYMDGAEILLAAVDAESESSVEVLECFLLKAKLFINMGKPRKGWLSVRRALNTALSLGLHRHDRRNREMDAEIWAHIWQFDRQLSMTLGFPYAISDSHPSISIENNKHYSTASRLLAGLAIICGHIIDRDQNQRNLDYSHTLQLEQEVQQYLKEIPSEWWSESPSLAMPLEEIYLRQTIKLFCYKLYKMLHLPYMLKSSFESGFEHSRSCALTASREMIKAYQAMRNNSVSAVIMCDLMDFEAFSAAVVLMIGLLSPTSRRDDFQDAEDWTLVDGLTKSLRQLSKAMKCRVAEQGAEVLEYLTMAYHGMYLGAEPFETTIPYFGKVRISRIERAGSHVRSEASSSNLQNSAVLTQVTSPFFNSVEFNAGYFTSFDLNPRDGHGGDAELGMDWAASFDPTADYDWNQLLYFDPSAVAAVPAPNGSM
ncbi:MAG: hypothetical protein LQ340_000595 [Diploschistes diacapsis]|nr:MAG: hypothetical protein LQ340_000595 [Diploschistes diacapsis]